MDKSFSVNSRVMNVTSVFQAAQSDKSLHDHLISRLAHNFSQSDVKSFSASYITCLKKIFVSKEDTQTCSASVTLEFAVKFLIFLIDEDSQRYEALSEKVIQFWSRIFDFFKEKHDIADAHIRKRICQFVARFMLLMSPEAELDCKICEIIVHIMKERIKDRSPLVRVQAILAVYRLQDGSDANCPVTKMLLNCIETDTAADVRKLALLKISLRHKPIVRVLIDRVDDTSEKVRKDAYLVFSKLHPLYFSSEDRLRLLLTGFYNNSENVRTVVKNVLLPAWFKCMDSDFAKFLHMFDLIFDPPVLVTKIVMSLIEKMGEEKSRETMDTFLDSRYVIPLEQLNCENAFYWRCYVFYTSGLVNEKGDYEWQSGKSYDAHAMRLLPDLTVFSEYMKLFHKSMCRGGEEDAEKWKKREQEFIFVQLIEMCKVYDYADEVGRKNLQLLCLNLLPEVEFKMLKPLIQLYFNLRTNLKESIRAVTDEVNNILYPTIPQEVTESTTNAEEMDVDGTAQKNNSKLSMILEHNHSLRFQIAKFEVQLEELNDKQEEAIRVQDFTKAESLKDEITFVRGQLSFLKNCICTRINYDSIENEEDQAMEDEDMESVNPLENMTPDTILRCVTILREMLNLSLIKSLTSELRALLHDFVLFAYKSDNRIIAPLATELLGSFCLRDKKLASEHFVTVFSLCANSDLCVSALRVIFDFLACFGPETFNITNLNEKNESSPKGSTSSLSDISSEDGTEKNDDTIPGGTFISTLVNLLDDEYIEARHTVAHGLCRLMCIGKLKSAKVLSRLIIIWFHPASRDAVEIRSCLNFFFPLFVKCKWSLPIFEEAIIPTMDILFDAPAHNPISEIDQKAVLRVLCDITNPDYVSEKNKPSDNIHPNLAVLICQSIITKNKVNDMTVLLKALEYLNLFGIHPSVSSTISKLLQKIIKKFKKNRNIKLAAVAEKLKEKLATIVENNCDSVAELRD